MDEKEKKKTYAFGDAMSDVVSGLDGAVVRRTVSVARHGDDCNL